MRRFPHGGKAAAITCAALAAPFLSGCPKTTPAGSPSDTTVRAFYTGVIAFQVGDDVRADRYLTQASQLAPEEPAIWADLGLFRMRQGNLSEAASALDKARTLAPQSGPIALLSGILFSRQGHFDQAITAFKQAAEAEPKNLHARYALAQTIERQGGPTADQEFESQMDGILTVQPTNLLALLESARAAGRGGNAALLKKRLDTAAARAGKWPPEAQAQLKAVRGAASGPNPRSAAIEVVKLKNLLSRLPDFRFDSALLELSTRDVAPPVEQFLKLPVPPASPAPPDMGLVFTTVPLGASKTIAAARAIVLDEKSAASTVLATDGKTLQGVEAGAPPPIAGGAISLPFPGGSGGETLTPNAVLPFDMNSDYRMDVALAGPGGFRLFQQNSSGAFSDITAKAKVPVALAKGAYAGAWAVDFDTDGDLDIVLGTRTGAPTILRNNGDGTFAAAAPFAGITSGLHGFAWGDVRGDGVADAALLDGAGKLHLYQNNRSGIFQERTDVPQTVREKALALSVADADGDGLLDFIVWGAGGQVVALCQETNGTGLRVVPLFQTSLTGTHPRLFAADMDDNGVIDYVVSAGEKTQVWLGDGKKTLTPLPAVLDFATEDLALGRADGAGMSLVGLAKGSAVLVSAKGTKNYHAQILRPRAHENAGDQRINSFGVGGEVELRTGLLYQKLPISGPIVRFGLGTQTGSDYARILWPNGSVQGEFELKADQALRVEQRLKGSCPFLFAWNGTKMAFVTDCIWRSPLGLRINAQNTAGVAMTEDRVKLRGDQLVPRNGFYELSISADLWETHYFDHLSLMTVDHPENTDIFVDERFAIPPPPLEVSAFAAPRPVVSAHDDKGADVTEIVRERDGRSVDTFGRGRFQGVTRDHFLELDLGPLPKNGKPVYLIANGWIHPTDSSINVALAQGDNGKPSGLSLEVPNGKGGWTAAKPALGFPAGKVKTVLIRLDDLPPANGNRRIRLRTNLEIYWDQVLWAEKQPQTPLRARKIPAETAELYYRGFATVCAQNASSPELPVDFDQIQSTVPIWRDLIGYYTRFGDVRELVAGVDDRYVIMNAGDGLRLRYPVPAPPPKGWKRDFVMVSDGWEKDGDYNTGFSKTVLPLPSHADKSYTRPPARLEDDPVYQRHSADWQKYHTRYVTPDNFINALRPLRNQP